MTSLVFGTEALRQVKQKFDFELKMPDGEVKIKQRMKTVIEQTDQVQSKGVFKIGHSISESMTFMPSVQMRNGDATQSVYVDVAGLQDTGGDFIDYINSFVTKQLFKSAKSVRFLVAITYSSLMESRGKILKD